TVSRHAVARNICRGYLNGEGSAYTGGQKHAFHVIPGIGHTASDRGRATEDVTLIGVATHGDFQVEVVDKGVAGCWSGHIGPCQSNPERFRAIRYSARKGLLLTSRRKQLARHLVVERMSNGKDVEEVVQIDFTHALIV